MKLSRPPAPEPDPCTRSVRSHCTTQCGIQCVMIAFIRDDHIGLVIVYGRVTTGTSGVAGGGSSTLTTSVDSACVAPVVATTLSTYSPGAENVAVVTTAPGSANVTAPGPDTLRQL